MADRAWRDLPKRFRPIRSARPAVDSSHRVARRRRARRQPTRLRHEHAHRAAHHPLRTSSTLKFQGASGRSASTSPDSMCSSASRQRTAFPASPQAHTDIPKRSRGSTSHGDSGATPSAREETRCNAIRTSAATKSAATRLGCGANRSANSASGRGYVRRRSRRSRPAAPPEWFGASATRGSIVSADSNPTRSFG